MDFTVIPYILFVLKFIYIIFKEIKKMDFNLIVTKIYIVLVVYTLFVWAFRRYILKKKTHEKEKEKEKEK